MSAPNAAVHADAVRVLSAWEPADPGQQALRHAFLGLLAARPDGCARSWAPGHLTASAVVRSHDGTQRRIRRPGHCVVPLGRSYSRFRQMGGVTGTSSHQCQAR